MPGSHLRIQPGYVPEGAYPYHALSTASACEAAHRAGTGASKPRPGKSTKTTLPRRSTPRGGPTPLTLAAFMRLGAF